MRQRVVAFTGISGVGKTTFLRRLAEQVSFQHVTGGSLIAAARQAMPDKRDALRHADLDENQRLLIDGFAVARDPAADLVVMDGHVVIDDGRTLNELPTSVFRALGVTLIVHLEADPAWIAGNRSRDASRSRPTHAPEALSQHQAKSHAHATAIAEELNIDICVVAHADVAKLAAMLSS